MNQTLIYVLSSGLLFVALVMQTVCFVNGRISEEKEKLLDLFSSPKEKSSIWVEPETVPFSEKK